MTDIFLSYAHEDRTIAEEFARTFEGAGLTVWWDGRIQLGSAFADDIEEAIRAASCVVVVWSTHSVLSQWVRNEAQVGMERGVLVPVLVERVKPPLAFLHLQAADLTKWDGRSEHAQFAL